ncbi:hypothetical protein ABT167_36540 [Streptomyces sp. NPDC001792]|uniref:hypothetical protein n=1 Tax=Streptomyces sp. NPDC001792 TaxID=3154524 RepID=UPI00331EF96F
MTRTVPASVPPASTTPSASPTPTSAAPTTTAALPKTAPPATPRHLTNASAVVSQYYQDITDHDYAAAWALGGSHIAGTTYDRWVAGFNTTQSITLGTISAFGDSRVHAVLHATQTDGTAQDVWRRLHRRRRHPRRRLDPPNQLTASGNSSRHAPLSLSLNL